MPEKDSCAKPNSGKGTVAILSVAAIASWGWMLWQAQNSSTDTLKQLTNQRLAHVEEHTGKDDHPIWHTESIETIKKSVAHNDVRSEERRQEMLVSLRRHEEIEGHHSVATKITALEEKLVEVETQFRHLDRLIQLLWQRTYDEPLPNPPGKD